MKWWLRSLLADKRFRIAGVVALSGFFLVLLGLVLPFAWLTKVGLFVGVPVLALGLLGAFALTALFLVKDYKRSGA